MNRAEHIKELLQVAWTRRREEDYQGCQSLTKQAHKLCESTDFELLGRVHHIYAQIESDHNRLDKALDFYTKARDYYLKSGNQDKIAHSTRHLADAQQNMKNYKEAQKNYKEAINIYRSNDSTHPLDLANALAAFGTLLKQIQEMEEAIPLWQEVRELYSKLELQEGVEAADKTLKELTNE